MKKPAKGKRPTDLNKLAFSIVEDSIAEDAPPDDLKSVRAVELGQRGGKRGGPARASSLTAEQRSEIAKKAAQARWAKPRS